MTPEERSALQRTGDLIFGQLMFCTTVTLFYSFLLAIFAFSTYSLLCRVPVSPPNRWMFAATCLSFLVSTVRCALALSSLILRIIEDLVKYPAGSDDAAGMAPIGRSLLTLFPVLPITSDCILVWRCWVLFAERRRAMLLPLTLLFGTIVTGALAVYPGMGPSISSGLPIQQVLKSSVVNDPGVQHWLFQQNYICSLVDWIMLARFSPHSFVM
ncbi:hypothetical protein LshimejAT787_0312160 [Lyophyllum shimeji]|uniref:Uncharacterized protein n=1 Tax=Lyophyllum shimeji TaxID=47721 RepID=A0A9P3PK47_LYOSH|nr:hypothetical protein LshimejAT787_0312160 [Lyophyllum shimeji]